MRVNDGIRGMNYDYTIKDGVEMSRKCVDSGIGGV